ncbi:ANTAR domain-containing protein [Streptomyces sp. NPDC017941]|uniref:ANTAR domain-containing protein n=1 Tax=unclassified Streptomyces TaxID=2593676 RepID=UPI0037A470A1
MVDQRSDPEPRISVTESATAAERKVAAKEQEISELRAEVGQLKHAVRAHATVDQAIGALAAISNIRPEQAWDVLTEVSQHTNTKLRLVAEQVVEWTCDGELSDDVRRALRRSLARQEPCAAPSS